MTRTYQSYMNQYNSGIDRFLRQFDNPYSFSFDAPSRDTIRSMVQGLLYRSQEAIDDELSSERSILNRVFSPLLMPNYVIAGMVDGMIDGSGEGTRTPIEGLVDGLRAGNPFGNRYLRGETTFSDVLETAGWQPESTAGKITKGGLGFVMDVAFDPLTYLTGGASAVVKGTGRVGKAAETLAKTTDDVARMAYLDEIAKQQVEKYGGKKLAVTNDMIDQAKQVENRIRQSGAKGMSPEMAEVIIRRQIDTRNANLRAEGLEPIVRTEDDIKVQAERLADEFNRLLGIRDAKGSGTITFGIGNMPFAPKKWRDKVITLGSAEPLRKLSDALGVSSAYAGIRNFVYGSEIGKMLSSKSPLWRLAHDNPGKLWEALEYVEHTRGLKMNKLEEERKITEFFKSLNLTPEENKEILKLLQDKTIWKHVKQKINLRDMSIVAKIREEKLAEQALRQNELDSLLARKAEIEERINMIGSDLANQSEELQRLKAQYQRDLMEFDPYAVDDLEKLDNYIKALNDELNELDNIIQYKERNPERARIEELAEVYQKHRKEFDTYMENREKLRELKRTESIDVENVKFEKEADGEYYNPTEIEEGLRQEWNRAVDDELLKMADEAPANEAKQNLIKGISEFVYGNQTALSLKMSDEAMEELVTRIQRGDTPGEIREFISQNYQIYDAKNYDMYSFIGRQLGYTSWAEKYKVPVGKMLGIDAEQATQMSAHKLRQMAEMQRLAGKLEPHQVKQLAELNNLFVQREAWVKQLSSMNKEELLTFIRDYEHAQLMEDIAKIDHRLDPSERTLAGRRADDRLRFTDEDRARAEDPYFNDGMTRKSGEFDDDTPENIRDWVTPDDAHFIHEDIFRHIMNAESNKAGVAIDTQRRRRELGNLFSRPSTLRWVNAVKNEIIQTIGKEIKRPYTTLSSPQRFWLVKDAIRKVNSKDVDPTIVEGVKASIQHQERQEIVKAISETLRPGYDVTIRGRKGDGFIMRRGEVINVRHNEAGFPSYDVRFKDGHVMEGVTPDMVQKVRRNKTEVTTDELLRDTGVAQAEKMRRAELLEDFERASQEYLDKKKAMDDTLEARRADLEKRITEYEKNIARLQEEQNNFNKMLRDMDESGKVDELQAKLDELEDILNNDDALETYLRTHAKEYDGLEQALHDFDNGVDAGLIALDNIASSEKVAKTVKVLRDVFIRMGKREVDAGILDEKAFEALLNQYVPHILTREGERFFAEMRDLSERGSKLTHDLGYGVVFNPHNKSRTIKGKTIEEINEYFRDKLKGKNLFSENVADIFLARAMKHTELMYDDKYMRTMMNVFGKEIDDNIRILDGYKPVMNHGMMRETVADLASMNISMQISEAVSAFLERNINGLREMARANNRNFDEFLNTQIEEFLKREFPDDTLQKMWEENRNSILERTQLPVSADEAVPMVEVSRDQIKQLRDMWNEVSTRYENHLKRRMANAIKYYEVGIKEVDDIGREIRTLENNLRLVREQAPNDVRTMQNIEKRIADLQDNLLDAIEKNRDNIQNQRVLEVLEKMDKFERFTPPQIRQVNDAIVQKANQARKLQIAKDQSRLLQLYDKFLHFMKLNQTVVAPSFHARNKLSNMYQNWLGIGRDAFNPTWQRVAMAIARRDGDRKAIEALKNSSEKWQKRFEPIVINNPHPSIAQYLNHGVLHWEDAYDLAVRYGVIDTGQFARDIGAGSASRGVIPALQRENISLDPTDTENFVLYQKGTEVGTVVENSDRLIHFVSQLAQGKSIAEADRLSKKYLFDYSDLTAFEQNVMKRIFPYYTWLRKNARLQVSQAIENPEKLRTVAKIISGIEHMTPAEDRMNPAFVSDWAEDWVQLPFSATNDYGAEEPIILNPALPFMDFNRIPDPTQPLRSARELFTQMAPHIRNPIELGTNYSSFFNDRIAKNPEDMPREYAKYLANQFALGNITTGFFGRDNALDVGLHGLNTMIGVKMNSYDYERSKYMHLEDMERDAGNINSAIDRLLARLMEREE